MARLIITTFKVALKDSGGNQSIIAQRLKCTRQAVSLFLKKNPKMRLLLDAEAEKVIDAAENVLDSSITKNKDLDSAKWKLIHSKRGKARGYTNKQEIEIAAVIATFTKEEREAEIKRLLRK